MRRCRGEISVHTFNSWGSYFCEWHGMNHWIPQIHMGKSPVRKKSRARLIPNGKLSLISFEAVRCFWVLELFFQLHGLIRKIYYIYDYVNCSHLFDLNLDTPWARLKLAPLTTLGPDEQEWQEYRDSPKVRHFVLINLHRFQPLSGTSTTNAAGFLSV